MSASFKITSGPPKGDLLPQLLDIGRMLDRPALKFEVRYDSAGSDLIARQTLPAGYDPAYLELYVYGLIAEDGSGNNWILQAYLKDPLVPGSFELSMNVKGFYDAKNRKGWLKVA